MKRYQWIVLLGLVLAVAAPSAYGWGYATHALVADDIEKQGGARNYDEIYGSCAPDMFNTAFALPVYGPGGLYELTHDNAEQVWGAARRGRERSLAVGFCSHSDVFGADQTAHHDGITYGAGAGYVIAKVTDMQTALAAIGYDLPTLLAPLPIPGGAEEEIYHSIIEYAVDVLTVRIDPTVGTKIAEAARRRSDRFPALFFRAYRDELTALLGSSAEAIVGVVEEEFRQGLIQYGNLLTLEEAEILAALSLYIADFAADYLALWGVELPEGFDPVPLIGFYLQVAMDLCAADYPAELAATLNEVQTELDARNIHGSADGRRARRHR